MVMFAQRLALAVFAALSSLTSSLASEQQLSIGERRNLMNDNLPPCKANDFETDFYMVDTSIDVMNNVCTPFQLATIGAFIQDVIEQTELLMPEFKKEYMKALVCPFAQAEDDRRLLLEADHRKLTNKWKWKGRRGRCKRCRNRTPDRRYLSTAVTASSVCAEAEKTLRSKMSVKQSIENVEDMIVSITEMAWFHWKEDAGAEIEAAEEALRVCDEASKVAATAARRSITLCEEASAFGVTSSKMKGFMKTAKQAGKDAEEAFSQALDTLARIELLHGDLRKSIDSLDYTMDRRALSRSSRSSKSSSTSSSDEDMLVAVDTVCAQIEAAGFYESLAERDLQHARNIVEEMKEMSKDHWQYKEIRKTLEDAAKACDRVADKRDDTIKKGYDVKKRCDKAKQRPKDAVKLLGEAKKKTEDVAKKALETNEKLSKVKEEEMLMLQYAAILGFDPAMAELEETVRQDNERISKDIKEIEDKIEDIDGELEEREILSSAQVQLLEQKRASYVQQKQYLQGILLSNNDIVATQEALQRENYYTSIGRSSERGEPLEIVLVSNGIRNVNWNPFTTTSTLSDWFEKFANLLLDALETNLPNYNSTTLGCLDSDFEVTVNVTEVQGGLPDNDDICVNTVFGDDDDDDDSRRRRERQ